MSASEKAIAEQAEAIATLASAIAEGRLTGPRYAAAMRLADMAETLAAWVEDDRQKGTDK